MVWLEAGAEAKAEFICPDWVCLVDLLNVGVMDEDM